MHCLVEDHMRNPTLNVHLRSLFGKKVKIRVRLYQTFLIGELENADEFSNILLKNAEEFRKDEEMGEMIKKNDYTTLLVRGDSIINLSSV